MPQRGSRRARDARVALLWGLFVFAGLQVLTAAALEAGLLEARDPEFAAKLVRLQARLAEQPNRPLILFLGSSRTLMSVRAADVEASLAGRRAVVFNFGVRGAGPVLELTCLRRLLQAGIRPALLFVEVIPPVLNQPADHPLEEEWLNGNRLTLAEIAGLAAYHSEPRRLFRQWIKTRWLPWSKHRHGLRQAVGADESPPASSANDPLPGELDDHGWQPYFVHGIHPERARYFLDIAQRQYRTAFGGFHLADRPVRALVALLDLCRQHEIPVAVVLMPEGSAFRARYPEPMRAGIDHFLEELSQAHQVPVVEARGWLGDEDFWDSHHQLPSGATAFTKRFSRDVLVPLTEHWPVLYLAASAETTR